VNPPTISKEEAREQFLELTRAKAAAFVEKYKHAPTVLAKKLEDLWSEDRIKAQRQTEEAADEAIEDAKLRQRLEELSTTTPPTKTWAESLSESWNLFVVNFLMLYASVIGHVFDVLAFSGKILLGVAAVPVAAYGVVALSAFGLTLGTLGLGAGVIGAIAVGLVAGTRAFPRFGRFLSVQSERVRYLFGDYVPTKVADLYATWKSWSAWKRALAVMGPLSIILVVAFAVVWWRRQRAGRKELSTNGVLNFIKGAAIVVGAAGVLATLSDLALFSSVVHSLKDLLGLIGLVRPRDTSTDPRNAVHKTMKVQVSPKTGDAELSALVTAIRNSDVLSESKLRGLGYSKESATDATAISAFRLASPEQQHKLLDALTELGLMVNVESDGKGEVVVRIDPEVDEIEMVSKMKESFTAATAIKIATTAAGLVIIMFLVWASVGLFMNRNAVWNYVKNMGSSPPEAPKATRQCIHVADCPLKGTPEEIPCIFDQPCNKSCGGHHCTHFAECPAPKVSTVPRKEAAGLPTAPNKANKKHAKGNRGQHEKEEKIARAEERVQKDWDNFFKLGLDRDMTWDQYMDLQAHGDPDGNRARSLKKRMKKLTGRLMKYYDAGYSFDDDAWHDYQDRHFGGALDAPTKKHKEVTDVDRSDREKAARASFYAALVQSIKLQAKDTVPPKQNPVPELAAANKPVRAEDYEDCVATINCGPEYPEVAGTMAKLSIGGKKYYALTAHQAAAARYATFKGKRYPISDELRDRKWLHMEPADLAYLPASELAIPGMRPLEVDTEIRSIDTACALLQFDEHGKLTLTPCMAALSQRGSHGADAYDIYHDATTRNGSCGAVLLHKGRAIGVHHQALKDRSQALSNVATMLRQVGVKEASAPATWKLPDMTLKQLRTMSRYDTDIKHGRYHGTLHSRVSLPEDAGYGLQRASLFERLPQHMKDVLGAAEPKFGGTKGSKKNFKKAVLKYDVPNVADLNDKLWDKAEAYVSMMLSGPLHAGTSSWTEVEEGVVRSTSPGFPYTTMGYRKKGDVLLCPEFKDYALSLPPAYFRQAWKFEWKEISDILAGKVRTFGAGPLHFYMIYNMIYARQNANLKNYLWIYHGFNPYGGGFNKLGQALKAKHYKAMRDWSGFDRMFALMRRVYRMRRKGLVEHSKLTPEEEQWADYIERELFEPKYVMDDGSVWSWPWSNPSGQPATTEDNTIGHILMEVRLLLECCPDAEYEDIVSNFNAMYGDDQVGGYEAAFAKMADEAWFRDACARVIGVPIKKYVGGDIPVTDLSFLGADFKEVVLGGHRMFVPAYNKDRIRDAFIYNIQRMPEEVELQKCYSLLLMSWPHTELFEKLRAVYARMLSIIGPGPMADAFRKLGVPSNADMLVFYLGLEVGGTSTLGSVLNYSVGDGFSFSFPEVGGHKECSMNGKPQQPVKGNNAEKASPKAVAANVAKAQKLLAASYALAKGAGKGHKKPGDAGVNTPKSVGTGGGRGGPTGTPQGGTGMVGLGHGSTEEVRSNAPGVGARNNGAVLTKPYAQGGDMFRKSMLARRGHSAVEVSSVLKKAKEMANAPRMLRRDATELPPVPLTRDTAYGPKQIGTMTRSIGINRLETKSVGISQDNTVRIGKMHRHEYTTKGGRAIQFVGSLWLSDLAVTLPATPKDSTGATITGASQGTRLASIPLNAASLGGVIHAESRLFMEQHIHHLEVKYVHTVPNTTAGEIAVYTRADPTIPMYDTGSDEVAHAASTGEFLAASVCTDWVHRVDPLDVTKAVFTQDSSDPRFEFEGMLTIIATEPILANVLGDMYVNVDISFMGEALSYELDDPSSTLLSIAFYNPANQDEGTPIQVVFQDNGIPPPLDQVNGVFVTPPSTTDVMAILTCMGYSTAPVGGGLQFCLENDSRARAFDFGQSYVMTFSNRGEAGAVDWSDGTIVGKLSIAMSDEQGAAPFAPNQFQCIKTDSAVATSGNVWFKVRFVPLDSDI